MRNPLIVFLVGVSSIAVPSFVPAQDSCDKQFVVSQVNLAETTHLSRSEQATIRAGLIGRCFDDQELGQLAGSIRDALHDSGYLRAKVSEPSFAISDNIRQPKPVSLNVEVEEGPRYRVSEIDVTGSKVVPFEQIISVIQLGDFLEMSKVRESLEAVRRL